MRRTVLVILAFAGGLVALLVIAVAIAISTIDVRTFAAPVQARVKADTGRELAFGGPLELKLSLEPRLVASDVSLANAPWGQAPQMIKAKRLEVQVALLPLLSRRFQVVELALIEPVIALETDAQGHGNWDIGGPVTAAAPTPSAAEAVGAGAVAFANVTIEDGTLTYRDGVTGKVTNVTIDRLVVHSRTGSAPIDAEFRGRIDDVAVALTGNLGPLDALRERRWPYPVAVKGEIDGKPASVSTKLSIRDDTTTFDAFDVAWGPLAAKGDVRVVKTGGRKKYLFTLSAPSWSFADAAVIAGAAATTVASPPAANAPAPAVSDAAKSPAAPATARPSATAASPPASSPPSRFLFSERPLPLALLAAFDAEGDLAVTDVVIDSRNRWKDVKLKVLLAGGKLDVPSFAAAAYGGTLSGRLTLDASRPSPAMTVKADGRDLDLGALLVAIGERREVRGGKTAIALDLAARGNSLHQWAASASGQALMSVGPSTLVNTRLDVNDVMDSLSRAVNPFRERDPSTELLCAVIRLPLADGIARVERSIAMQTAKIAVSASGTLDFRDERLDLTLRPRVKAGIPIDIPQMAELVHFTGPFTRPAVKIDAVASAAAIAKIGAAIGTSGLSVIGTSLFAKIDDQGNACEVALGRGATAGKPAPEETTKPPVEPVGNAIGKALGKLFGR